MEGAAPLLDWLGVQRRHRYARASALDEGEASLAGHAAVTTVVLNQVDTLSPDQADDCRSDLRRLLDAEGLTEIQVLVTSATTGVGLDELRRVLASAVAVRQAASERITADIDALLERFAVYAGASVPGWLPPASRAPALAVSPTAAPTLQALQSHETESASAQVPTRPPWELDDGGESESGRVGAADWQPW